MKICVITPRYAIAGVPLAQLRFAQVLSEYGHDVDLIIGRVDSEYPVPDVIGVNVLKFKSKNVRGMFFPFRKYLKSVKPDIVFSAEDHLNIIVLLAAITSRSKTKISGSSRVTPFDTYSNVPFSKRWILKQFARLVMWRADALTCVSKDMVLQYQQVFKSSSHVCVYNIIGDSLSREKINEQVTDTWFLEKKEPILVAAGRLASWKGFSDLIYAMKELQKMRKTKLIIFGDGPLKSELQELIDTLDLKEVIKLFGYTDNPLKYFKHADVFILSSHVEGLPNVLIEAMMCGCTIVSTDCPTGPSEVLQNNKYGYLVPVKDYLAMSKSIIQALDNPISEDLLNEAIVPFSVDAVIKKHFEALGIENLIFKTGQIE